MATDLVFYLHRLGFKIYEVGSGSKVTEVFTTDTLDPAVFGEQLTAYSGRTFRLLLSDSISYLLKTDLTPGQPLSRESVLTAIKPQIPENFDTLNWDYKVLSRTDSAVDILVFAPVFEYQSLIARISDKFKLHFEVIEPEAVSGTRNPNPIIGITSKDDLGAKDEQSLNLTVTPTVPEKKKSGFPVSLIIIIFIFLFVAANYFLYLQYRKSVSPPTSPVATVSPTKAVLSPTATPSSPSAPAKAWSALKLSIQNGTGKSGYAGAISVKFQQAGLKDIATGNASDNTYSESILTFSSETLKNAYKLRFTDIHPVLDTNIRVDKNQSFDAILILGTN